MKCSKGMINKSRSYTSDRNLYYKMVRQLAIEISVVCTVMIIMLTCVIGITVQMGNDMFPSIKDGDIVIYYRTTRLLPTETVVYRTYDGIHTGRIAAASGALISETGDHQLTVDGIYQPVSIRDGIYSLTYSGEKLDLPLTIGQDQFFILNDNRDRMDDSRTYGAIDTGKVSGRVISVFRIRI